MTLFTDRNFQAIKNAIAYTQATIQSGRFGPVRRLHIERLCQSHAYLAQANDLTEKMLEENPATNMFFAHIEINFLLGKVEGFICVARSKKNFWDGNEEPEPESWVSISEDRVKACDHCFDKGSGILAQLDLALFDVI
jgi:hypothetical protein